MKFMTSKYFRQHIAGYSRKFLMLSNQTKQSALEYFFVLKMSVAYIEANVLLNLLNKLRKREKNARLAEHFLSFSRQAYHSFIRSLTSYDIPCQIKTPDSVILCISHMIIDTWLNDIINEKSQ